MSLIGALTTAPLLHRTMSVKERLENSMTGLCLLQLAEILAQKRAVRDKVKPKQLWLDPRTSANLKDLCSATIVALYCVREPVCWWNLHEWHLEAGWLLAACFGLWESLVKARFR